MTVASRSTRPQAVLFACGLNSVRSPMAAHLFHRLLGNAVYVRSAGVRKGELDPFAVAALDEIGLDIRGTAPPPSRSSTSGRGSISISSSRSRPRRITARSSSPAPCAVDVEYWPTPDPTGIEGSREQRLDAYRRLRPSGGAHQAAFWLAAARERVSFTFPELGPHWSCFMFAAEIPNGRQAERLGAPDHARAQAIYLAARDRRVPWYAKVLALCVAGYALSPIDLIPDFIPVLGYLDDVVIVPLGILAVVKLIPPNIMAEHRAAASLAAERPVSRTAAFVIGLIWAASSALSGWVGYWYRPLISQRDNNAHPALRERAGRG